MKFLPRKPRPVEDPAAWALADLADGDVLAVKDSFGQTFGGELTPTVAFLLDRWAQDYPEGMRWRVLESEEGPTTIGRAQPILDAAFESTRSSLARKAMIESAGDLEAAIRAAMKEIGLAMGLRPPEAVADVVDRRLAGASGSPA